MLMEHEKSLSDLVRDLTKEIQALFQENINLVKAEATGKLQAAKQGGISASMGGALLYAGLLSLVASAVFALGLIMPLWASALIIGAVLVTVGGIMAAVGAKKMQKATAPPRQTMDALKEEKTWMKKEMHR